MGAQTGLASFIRGKSHFWGQLRLCRTAPLFNEVPLLLSSWLNIKPWSDYLFNIVIWILMCLKSNSWFPLAPCPTKLFHFQAAPCLWMSTPFFQLLWTKKHGVIFPSFSLTSYTQYIGISCCSSFKPINIWLLHHLPSPLHKQAGCVMVS